MKIFCSAFFILSQLFINHSGNLHPQSFKIKSPNVNLPDTEEFIVGDSLKKEPVKNSFRMKKSPLKAVLYSAILPGAGQFYNKSYWKIPVIAALGGYFVYEIIDNNNSFLDFKQQYQNSQTSQNPDGDLRLKNLREFYRDQRDDFIIYSAILYVINLIDAYVDAELYDFDVSDNIKLNLLDKNKFIKLDVNF